MSKKIISLSSHGGDIRRVFMLGQELKMQNPDLNLIDLSLGNPDVEHPKEVDQALISLLGGNSTAKENPSHRYMDAAGLPEVRNYIASQLSISEGVSVVQDSVYLTVGAAGGLQILLRSFLDEGDEAIIFSPFFPEYVPYILNFDAVPVICPCDAQHKPNVEAFAKLITNKTKLVLLNSPNNPSGVVYPRDHLEKIFAVLNEKFKSTGQVIHVVSDEPYSRVIYKNEIFPNILPLYPFSWVVRSYSKDLCLAGERIGYIAWSESLLKQLPFIPNTFRNASRILGFVCAPRLMQSLIPHIYHERVDVDIYENRVSEFVDYLTKNGFNVVKPQAGFFVFPQSPIQDDRLFCDRLVSHGVLCVPGSGFGSPGYFRASLTQDISLIEEAARRIVDCARAA